ncbi:MAG TPA: hypothetical protein VLJ11_08570 [Bryobacteraceae bacterium]|nr:hypothetical protein [Bryobacteraceae bacterium]
MKSVLFTYDSPLGTFWIRPEPAGRVQLGIDKLKLRTFTSPKAAAEAVRSQSSGYEEWDRASGILVPSGLEKWKTAGGYGRPKSRAKAKALRSEAERADSTEERGDELE